jgi:hypothetical protein
LSSDIVDAMFTVKELMLSPAGTVAEPLDAGVDELAEADPVEAGALDELDELDDEHPATVMPTTAAVSPTQPSRRKPRSAASPCEWEGRPPLVLIICPIPYVPSLERVLMSRCGTPYSTCVPSRRKHAARS